MRYGFHIEGRRYLVTLEEHAAGPRFVVDGDTFDPEVKEIGKGHYQVKVDGTTHEFRVDHGRVLSGHHTIDLEVHRERPELSRVRAGGRRADGRIKPPMPGKLVEIRVKPGDTVAEGDVVAVLEAMKMQNDLRCPVSGTVKAVLVKTGANVESSTVILEVDV